MDEAHNLKPRRGAEVGTTRGTAMPTTSPKSDRLEIENSYLLVRSIETNTEMRDVLHALLETISGLHAMENIKLLKASELAKNFQISTDRVYELMRTRGLPAVSLGAHQIRFDPIAVRHWLDEGGRTVLEASEESEQKKGLHAVAD